MVEVLRIKLADKNIRVQELVAKFALRIVFPAQVNKFWQLLVKGFELRRRRGEQLAPVRPGFEWSQFFFDHRQQLPDRWPVLFPGKVNGYAGLFVTGTQPEFVGGDRPDF